MNITFVLILFGWTFFLQCASVMYMMFLYRGMWLMVDNQQNKIAEVEKIHKKILNFQQKNKDK